VIASVLLAALGAAGCGGEIEVPKQETRLHRGAVLFNERCSGCHSIAAANAYGSKPPGQLQGGERTNGPNFNVRKESRDDVLFAIRNGGFSGAIMPANVVVGEDAEAVADFLAKYSGRNGDGSSGG
jgi:mono/diheme cytochrome c family protein